MSGSERRNRERCSVCQGPTVYASENELEILCRNSLCSSRHQKIKCTRCGSTGPDATLFDGLGQFHYYCRECQHKWTQVKE